MRPARAVLPTLLFALACSAAPTATSGAPEGAGDPADARPPDAGESERGNGMGPACASCVDHDRDGFSPPLDCNDLDPSIHPGAVEVCNDKDDNCNGVIDEGFDADGDHYFVCPHGTTIADCDDHDPSKNDPIKPAIPVKHDGFVSLDRHWRLAGTAVLGSGGVVLTTSAKNQAGALFWAAPYLFDHFEVSFTFTLTPASPGASGLGKAADGITMAWVRGDNVNAVGAKGAGLGFAGLDGYAIAIDVSPGSGPPAAPFMGILTPSGKFQSTHPIPEVRDGKPHAVSIVLVGAKVTATLDGAAVYDDWPIEGYGPYEGHWGFTGGTGDLFESQTITDVSMLFPFGQGCVP